MKNLSRSTEHLISHIGSECVYKERDLVLHAQLTGISVHSDMVQFKFKRLATPGFTKRAFRTFTWESNREYVSLLPNRICCSLIGVELFFKESDVNAIVQLMQTSPSTDALLQKLRELRRS